MNGAVSAGTLDEDLAANQELLHDDRDYLRNGNLQPTPGQWVAFKIGVADAWDAMEGQIAAVADDGSFVCYCEPANAASVVDDDLSERLGLLEIHAVHDARCWQIAAVKHCNGNAVKRPRTADYDPGALDVDPTGGTVVDRYSRAMELKEAGNAQYAMGAFRDSAILYGQALALLTNTMSDWPLRAVTHANRAAAYIHMRDFLCAFGEANECLRLEPGNVKALWRRGIANEFLGRTADALGDYAAVAQMTDELPASERYRLLLDRSQAAEDMGCLPQDECDDACASMETDEQPARTRKRRADER